MTAVGSVKESPFGIHAELPGSVFKRAVHHGDVGNQEQPSRASTGDAAASVLGVPWLYWDAGILEDRQYSVAAECEGHS